uniref:Uncharacterized protein n=1 Tax=Plectus sambesii TaxID=2011161 RepID=A0A914WGJ8_9BILA
MCSGQDVRACARDPIAPGAATPPTLSCATQMIASAALCIFLFLCQRDVFRRGSRRTAASAAHGCGSVRLATLRRRPVICPFANVYQLRSVCAPVVAAFHATRMNDASVAAKVPDVSFLVGARLYRYVARRRHAARLRG